MAPSSEVDTFSSFLGKLQCVSLDFRLQVHQIPYDYTFEPFRDVQSLVIIW